MWTDSMFRTMTFAVLTALALATTALAQDDDEKKIPEPEDITLETKDGVQLKCTWYAGINGKNTVPVIIVHGWDGNRGQYDRLALFLQSKEGGGHAVIVPDLRGHGGSTTWKMPNGDEEDIDRERFTRNDIGAMVQYDMEAVKKHLMEENNAGDLNIELLTVIGSEFGGLIALGFAAQDWSWQQLPTIKQGRDVKALVLISPAMSFKGVTALQPLKHEAVRKRLSVLIVAGRKDRYGYRDAKRMYSQLEPHHQLPRDATTDQIREKKDLFLFEPDTSLSGQQLITAPGLNVASTIKSFIDLRLVDKREDFEWTDRTSPFGRD